MMDKTVRIVDAKSDAAERSDYEWTQGMSAAELMQTGYELTVRAWEFATGRPFPRMDRTVTHLGLLNTLNH